MGSKGEGKVELGSPSELAQIFKENRAVQIVVC